MALREDLVEAESVQQRIVQARGERVLLDRDPAILYGVETKVLVQAITRNKERFPEDFMFQLSKEEFDSLRSQIVTSKAWGGRRYRPYAFTEEGGNMRIHSDVADRSHSVPCQPVMTPLSPHTWQCHRISAGKCCRRTQRWPVHRRRFGRLRHRSGVSNQQPWAPSRVAAETTSPR